MSDQKRTGIYLDAIAYPGHGLRYGVCRGLDAACPYSRRRFLGDYSYKDLSVSRPLVSATYNTETNAPAVCRKPYSWQKKEQKKRERLGARGSAKVAPRAVAAAAAPGTSFH